MFHNFLEEELYMKKQIELGAIEAHCQKWEESEEGWGVRPDGFSLHLTKEGLKRYINEYWDSMPEEIPAEYSRPCGEHTQSELRAASWSYL